MARLLDLPDEILVMIIMQHLLREPGLLSLITDDSPFPSWVSKTKIVAALTSGQCIALNRIILSSKRFYSLLNDTLYTNINILTVDQLTNFTRTINHSSDLSSLPDTMTTICPSAYDIYESFFLPYLTTIQLLHFKDHDLTLLSEDNAHHHLSAIEHLNLISCGAHEIALTELLHWPKALKHFSYHVDQIEWTGHVTGSEEKGWECSALIRALSSQKHSLESLVLTRPRPVHEGLFYSDPLDVSGFSTLKSLSIYHVFLIGFSSENLEWPEVYTHKRLPESLEELHVFYDDNGYNDFLAREPIWLFSVLENVGGRLRRLKKIRVLTPEIPWGEDGDGDAEEGKEEGDYDRLAVENWVVPVAFKGLADAAGVDLKITLGYKDPEWKYDCF